MRKRSLAGLLALALSGATSAAAGPVLELPAADRQMIDSLLGAGVVGKALPSEPITDASVYFPLVEKTATYSVTSGKNAGKQQTLRVHKGQRPGGTPAWRFELSPTLAGFLNEIEGGNLMMPAVTDTGEGVVVTTTPANPFVIEGMQPGESRPLTQKVSVNYLDNPADQRYSGELTGTYTYLGMHQVTVPAGTFPTALIRLKYSGKVGPAETQDTAYYFFAPKVGVVAMISQEDVEAFWIIHIDTRSGKLLAATQ